MRIAFGTNPAIGHLLPLLPLADAAREAGHDVTIVAGASLTGPIARARLRHVVAGPPDFPTAFARVPEREGLTGRRLAAVTWSRVFAGTIAPELAAALIELDRSWHPDLVVHDDSEQGTWVAAETLGIPHVSLQATAWRGTKVRLSAEPLNELRASLGLEPDPPLERWHRHGYLTTRPPSLVDPRDPLPATARPIRPVAMDEMDDGVPAWLEPRDRDRRRVTVTLGTILPGRLDTMSAILDGLASLDAEVVATVGPGLEPAALGPRPPHVRVERYVPMSRLLATSDALVFHAGSGTMLAALALGVPLVLLPAAADQPENAERCAAAGVGIVVDEPDRTPEGILAATQRVLDDVAFGRAASGVAAEIAAMPAPAEVVPELERLAGDGPDGRLG